jgi:predicted transcriptional regulator of viral defense system
MQFIEFKQIFKEYVVFSKNEINKYIPGFNKMNLIYWQDKGYIKKIKNNWYCFTDKEISQDVLFNIANKIYAPSYISLETALSFYGFIPEAVFLTTSISTLKTNEFDTFTGRFSYRSVKKNIFFGYKIIETNKLSFKIAEAEKAILDFLYFNSTIKTHLDLRAFRLNKINMINDIDFNKITAYANLFNSKVLLKRLDFLKKYIDA